MTSYISKKHDEEEDVSPEKEIQWTLSFACDAYAICKCALKWFDELSSLEDSTSCASSV